MPEYRRKTDQYFERTDEEEVLANMFNLDDEQLNFRRSKIHDLGGEDLFRQEYPITPQEAFLTSGRLFVEPKFIDEAYNECSQIWRGNMRIMNSWNILTVH